MHILLGILSALGVIAFFLIRANHASQAARELGDTAGGFLGYIRRTLFLRKANQHPLSLIEDPREAVTALMVSIAKDKGDLTEQQVSFIETLAKERLEIQNSQDMVALARWHVRESVESGAVLRRVINLLCASCNTEQKQDIIKLLSEVALTPDDKMTDLQAHTINEIKYRFGDLSEKSLMQH